MLITRSLASRVLLSPIFAKRLFVCSSFSSLNSFFPSIPTGENFDFDPKGVALSFKEWFRSRDDILVDRIFEILRAKDEDWANGRSAEVALCGLELRLSEGFVLKVLSHGGDVLSCLKFFDWAGRQNGFNHTRTTFNAIFKILSKEKLMSLMLDFLETYKSQRYLHRVRFYDTLVMGYAVAGKPDVALQLFGKMRFKGLDLSSFAYHVLLNALVEESCFDAVAVVSKQITMQGYESEVTWCIRVKNLCKQKRLEEAEALVRWLRSNGSEINDYVVAVLVDAYCKRSRFQEAARLVEDFPHEKTYDTWIRDLVQAGKVQGAMDFLRSEKLLEGYVPDVYRYNVLICRLLKERRLQDVCDLLMEMRERKISPDKVTMNAALSFFCKAGMVDVALELYRSRAEFGLSLNSLTYNYLINTLCGDGSVDDAYRVLKDSVEQGYFLGKKTFSILAGALYREGKVDKMTDLINISLKHSYMPSDAVCVKFISALCKARRVEDGYMIYGELNSEYKARNCITYIDLIHGFNKANRGDMASRLLIEMQENGHSPHRSLYRAVIRCLCTMDNPESQFFKLLEMQLSCHEPSCLVYNFFIDGAGHAKRPDLARKVYEMMASSGVEPTSITNILMLQSCIKSERIADALNFYGDLCKKNDPGKKVYNTMIVGLCKVNKPDLAIEIFRAVRERSKIPSLQCYEELVRSYCSVNNYNMVVEVVDDLAYTGRGISSYMGNILLLHSLKNRELYQAFVRSEAVRSEAYTSGSLTIGQLVGLFSGGFRVKSLENLDEVIEQCFPLDIFTYNLLLRRLSMTERIDKAIELFYKICHKGYEPNRWTYEIIIQGLFKCDRGDEAKRWEDEMQMKGFSPNEPTEQYI